MEGELLVHTANSHPQASVGFHHPRMHLQTTMGNATAEPNASTTTRDPSVTVAPSFRIASNDDGTSTTTIVIIVVASIVGVLLLAFLAVCFIRRRRQSHQEAFVHPPTIQPTAPEPVVPAPQPPVHVPAPLPPQQHHAVATSETNSHFVAAAESHGTSPGLPSGFYDRGNSYNDSESDVHNMHHTRFTDLSTNSYASEGVSFSGSIMSDSSGSLSSRPYDSLGENDVAWKYMTESEKLRYMQSKDSLGANSLHDSDGESFASFAVTPSKRV
ncbi:hypothetical protein ACHHYP_09112 [Achlya hypogyna]|uniref:Transmembrane protein n=1 Tax=Achlya hypogyna TaxID=1202772 RepID=A0A1V9YNU4_ACHHY|nr:hypothetical protein ACHHYP_09112 [Achlya hypogyna]